MGRHFGSLGTFRGVITYKLSPFEQRAFAGAITHGVPNFAKRIRSNIFKVLPPFIIGYMVYTATELRHGQLMRKVPADYENDE